ncbi:alpha/beta hydrolase [Protaetiibacter mangrovi]|uniref:Alpha/beta hydrolase n=1 Tax=Protaetiibacter mangrovi TaxID=2970926 RepID=A0ABT1ZFZ6_9MICO|nr:alpha/beta hydrolase [Protaetiibacter mangrovi]MCS0499570.1 alpha/beta hydrolase [Protaetiibacter mangrovi]TPX05407.1 alpha/beta hydrolase [Schumannella luteola]
MSRHGRGRAARALLAFVAVSVLLTGCVSWFQAPRPSATSTPTGEQVSAELAPYYHQVLRWTGCGGGLQCATATAPLDWDDPGADTIELALIRQPATGGAAQGSLLINPGGPGGSGVGFIRDSIDFAASDTLQRDFDVVGFDPRGVGASTPIDCTADDAALDDYIYGIVPGERGSDAWIAASAQKNAAFGQGCLEHSGQLLAHVDTESAVRDLDMLRAALGDAALDYLGYSYGTYLGARYAERFPDKAGRLVLDGALDPSATEFDVTLTQAVGFESALTAYLTDCLDRDDCPFTGSVDAARARIAGLLHELDAHPLTADDGRRLGANTMFSAIILPLYNEGNWSYLDELFTDTVAGGTDTAFFLADVYNDRESDGSYSSNGTEAFISINCLDYPSDADPATMRSEAAELEEQAPVFGPWMAYGGTLCPQWPFRSTVERGPITAPGSPDILVVGTTNDPATPYVWAQALAGQLEHGHLITHVGEGHTAYGESECVTQVVDAFLVDGTVPASDPMC